MSERPEPMCDWLEGAIEAFRRMNIPERPPDAAVLAQLDAELDEKERRLYIPASSKTSGHLMRFLVPSAAAVMLAIASVVLLILNDTATIALADVVKAAGKHKLVRYREQQITDAITRAVASLDSTVYADVTAPRLYSESRVKDPDGESVILSIQDGKHHLTTNSRQRTARLELAPTGYKSLLCCLEEFQQKEGVTHDRRDLDGQATVRYRHAAGTQTIILWVDARTKLPLRLEQKSIDPSPGSTGRTLIWTDFAWDPELPQGVTNLNELFSTRPPSGYALDDQTETRKP